MPSRCVPPCDARMADPTLALRPDHLREVRRLLATHLPRTEVWAYGSRANGTAHDTSDLDLVVRNPSDLRIAQGAAFGELKEAFSASNLPFLVDLLDWASVPPAWQDTIAAAHVVLQEPATTATQAN